MKKISGQMLRHTRIQSFCAVAALSLAIVSTGILLLPEGDRKGSTTGNKSVAQPPLPVVEQQSGASKVVSALVTKQQVLQTESLKDAIRNKVVEHELDSPASGFNWFEAGEICVHAFGSAARLPNYKELEAVEHQVIELANAQYEWIVDETCDTASICDYRKVAPLTSAYNVASVTEWRALDENDLLAFRCVYPQETNIARFKRHFVGYWSKTRGS